MKKMNKTVSFTMNIDSEFHRRLKSYVAFNGLTIKDYIMRLIKKDMPASDTTEISWDNINNKTKKAITSDKRIELNSIEDLWKQYEKNS
jgi:NRPS condensation-like uncharacterized protein